MKKGFEWSVNLLFAVILGIIAAGMFWAVLSEKPPPQDAEPVKLSGGCNNNENCENNLNGSSCIVIYPGNFVPFCGCLSNDDCVNRRSGICDSNNKCK
jgi:hypothetical protein